MLVLFNAEVFTLLLKSYIGYISHIIIKKQLNGQRSLHTCLQALRHVKNAEPSSFTQRNTKVQMVKLYDD